MLRPHPSRQELAVISPADVVFAADMISRLQMQLAAPH
jgi:hypothetical protein